jgi:large subunit ribosomal protein L15
LLRERGLVASGGSKPIKILARGEMGKALTVRAHKFSGKAADKVKAAGGTTEVIG